jgi:hypothetical protein
MGDQQRHQNDGQCESDDLIGLAEIFFHD